MTFTTVSDNISEGDETVIFTMGTPTNATLGTQSATVVTITEVGATAPTGGGGGAMGIMMWLAMLFRYCCRGRYRHAGLRRPFMVVMAACLSVSACGGGGGGNAVPLPGANTSSGAAIYAIRGIVTGLTGTLVLQNKGGDDLTLTSNGGFTFDTNLSNGESYIVTVFTNPDGQTCTVSNASGTVNGGNVSGVSVTCVTQQSVSTYTVGGTISGLSGSVVLQNSGGDDLSLSSNGSFTFATAIGDGADYKVTVATPPAGQACAVANGTGTVSSANVSDVAISCAASGPVLGVRTASRIAAGRNHTCAILDSGAVKCWGHNDSGQLGLGDSVDRGRTPMTWATTYRRWTWGPVVRRYRLPPAAIIPVLFWMMAR